MELNYTDQGHGDVVVMLHGFCESVEIWNQTARELSKFKRVICIDLPGYGGSNQIEGKDISVNWFSEVILNFLDELSIQNCSIVGHSLGGYVALGMLGIQGHRIDSLVLFHSTSFADSEQKQQGRLKTYSFIERNGLATFMKSFVSPLFAESNREKYEEDIKVLSKVGAQCNQEMVLATILAMKNRAATTEYLEQFNKPILWIVGEQDLAVPLEDSLKQVELGTKTQALILKDCGHMGMFEKPMTTTMRLVEFFT